MLDLERREARHDYDMLLIHRAGVGGWGLISCLLSIQVVFCQFNFDVRLHTNYDFVKKMQDIKVLHLSCTLIKVIFIRNIEENEKRLCNALK